MNERQQKALMRAADLLMAGIPRTVPNQAALQSCKIISHRGEHDNNGVMENTLQAYEVASAGGVWGIECDIRWTADLVPVICHDPDGERVFGVSTPISTLTFAEVRARMPLLPSLEELVARFGGSSHLMLELKAELLPRPAQQKLILQQLLSPLEPGRDYHILGLDPDVFELVDFLPRQYCFPVSEEGNVAALSQLSIERGYGGLGGHFILLDDKLKRRHEQVGQRIGTGFVGSRNCLFRELNRGVEWIFSNDALKLQKILDRFQARHGVAD